MTINMYNSNNIFVATSNGIYRTLNANDDNPLWAKVFSGVNQSDGDFRSVLFKPNSNNTLYASSNNIFKSDNGGESWVSMTGPNTGLNFDSISGFKPFRINLAVSPANENRLFAYIWGKTVGDTSKIFIYYYENNKWNILFSDQGYVVKDFLALAISPTNASQYFFYGRMGIYGSNNLSSLPMRYSKYIGEGVYADGHVLEFQPNTPDPKLFFGHHAGISIGDMSSPNNWQFKNNGIQNMLHWSFDDSEFEKDVIITANQDCFSYLKENNEWKFIKYGGDSYSSKFSTVNKNAMYLSGGDYELMQYNKVSNILKNENSKIPYDGFYPDKKAIITKTFKLKSFPKDTCDYISFTEIYKRKFCNSSNVSIENLWEIDSDIGKIVHEPWMRQINEMDYCMLYPDVIYLATTGLFNINNSLDLEPKLYKTTIGGNNNNFSGINAYSEINYSTIGNSTCPVISGIAVHDKNPNKLWITLVGYDNIGVRVAYSEDGGNSWYNADSSNSLPKLPVNDIVYRYGSNDELYIATDVGVYFKDANMDKWEKYGNFPNVRVTEVKINYCQNKLRAATFGRSVWESNLRSISDANMSFLTINNGENIVWNNQKSLKTSIVIKSGGVLKVNSLLNMPKNSKIIVENGGKLFVNGGIIKNGCDEPWLGIEVWGDKNAHQFPDANGNYQQGYLELNNATIENAICAVNLWRPNHWSSMGGVVKATNSTFRNNTRSVHAIMYQGYYPSFPNSEAPYNATFKNCVFEITKSYIHDSTFYKHVDLNRVNGVSFLGCDFSVDRNASGVSEWNQAIASYSSGFTVNGICNSSTSPCTNYDNSTFTGFKWGIYVNNAEGNYRKYSVFNSIFNSNSYGIYSENTHNLAIAKNAFNIGVNVIAGCPDASGFGVYTTMCPNINIVENSFGKIQNAPNSVYTGVFTENSGSANDIYKNSFTGLNYGNYAKLRNHAAYSNLLGLEYICNTNIDNKADFYIPKLTSQEAPQGNSIQAIQGIKNTSAGNIFSQSSNNEWHFYNGGSNWINYFYKGAAQYIPNSAKIYNVSLEESNVAHTCPDVIGVLHPTNDNFILRGAAKTAREQSFTTNKTNYLRVKALYDALVDGGSTDQRLLDISTAQPQDAWALRNELLGFSPHLTDTVLKKVADKTDVFQDALIFDIFAANPDELRKTEVIEYLENKENPLPDYMIEILQGMADGETYRTVLEKQMSMYGKEMSRAAYDLIRSCVYDTIVDYSEVRTWLNNLGGLDADLQIISTYLQEKNFSQALSLTNMLPSLYNITGNNLVEHGMFANIIQLYNTLNTEGRNLYNLTEAEQNMLLEIAESSKGEAGAMARSWKVEVLNAYSEDCFTNPTRGSTQKPKTNLTPDILSKINGLYISVKPNPAKDYAIFEYKLPENQASAVIQILDIAGKVVQSFEVSQKQGQKTWDTGSVKAGIYFYSIKSGNQTSNGKVTIVK